MCEQKESNTDIMTMVRLYPIDPKTLMMMTIIIIDNDEYLVMEMLERPGRE